MMAWAKMKLTVLVVGVVVAVAVAGEGITVGQRDAKGTTTPADSASPATTPSLSAVPSQSNTDAAVVYRKACVLLPKEGRDRQAIGDWDAVPLTQYTTDLLDRYKPCVELLHRAVAMPSADWQMSYSTPGVHYFLGELGSLRSLHYLSLLRARAMLSQRRDGEAIADMIASMALARHISEEPILVSRLVGLAITIQTTQFAAKHLPELSPQATRELLARMDHLPRMTTSADMFKAEQKYAVAVSHEQGTQAMVQGLSGFYGEAVRVAALPPDQFDRGQKELAEKAKESGVMAGVLLPSFSRAMENDHYAQVMEAMLRAAIHVQLDGMDSLRSTRDPYGNGPFEYRKLSTGVELRSRLVYKGEPATLTVGK